VACFFLSIGSNIEPATHFKQCAITLESMFTDVIWSPVYQSVAVGMVGDDFLNAVIQASTEQSIDWVVETIKQIEDNQGRVRGANKFTSRTLDLDLLLYDDCVLNKNTLTLPRDEITTALHVLLPLADLVPTMHHPAIGKTYSALLNELLDQQKKRGESVRMTPISIF